MNNCTKIFPAREGFRTVFCSPPNSMMLNRQLFYRHEEHKKAQKEAASNRTGRARSTSFVFVLFVFFVVNPLWQPIGFAWPHLFGSGQRPD
jgi:hypothetical protein